MKLSYQKILLQYVKKGILTKALNFFINIVGSAANKTWEVLGCLIL